MADLGGTGLFLGGHLAFTLVVWQRLNWPRAGALVALALLGLLAPQVSALVPSASAAAVVVAVAVADLTVGACVHEDRADSGKLPG